VSGFLTTVAWASFGNAEDAPNQSNGRRWSTGPVLPQCPASRR